MSLLPVRSVQSACSVGRQVCSLHVLAQVHVLAQARHSASYWLTQTIALDQRLTQLCRLSWNINTKTYSGRELFRGDSQVVRGMHYLGIPRKCCAFSRKNKFLKSAEHIIYTHC